MKRDVEFLYELGSFRLLQRQWRRFHLPTVANNSEHSFRVAWIALLLAEKEGGKLNREKIMKMALVHDLSESRTADVDYMSRQYVTRDQVKAIEDTLETTSLGKEFLALWHEYEDRNSLEAKIVKDADILDVDLEMRELAASGSALIESWKPQRDHVGAQLFTKSAKALQKEIRKANPYDWHLLSPNNRLNGGDWKEKK